jgi:hypothetical protein
MRLNGNFLLPAFGVLIVALMVAAFVFRDRAKGPYLGQFKAPVVALELARSGDEIRTLLREVNETLPDKAAVDVKAAKAKFGKIQDMDNTIFIPTYVALLSAYCALLFYHRFAGARLSAVAAFVCVIAGAACDYLENHGIARALGEEPGRITDAMAEAIRVPSLWKWGLIFFAILLLSTMFFMSSNRWWSLAGLAFSLGSVLGLYGLFDRVYVERAMTPILFGLFLSAILFIVSAPSFLKATRIPFA